MITTSFLLGYSLISAAIIHTYGQSQCPFGMRRMQEQDGTFTCHAVTCDAPDACPSEFVCIRIDDDACTMDGPFCRKFYCKQPHQPFQEDLQEDVQEDVQGNVGGSRKSSCPKGETETPNAELDSCVPITCDSSQACKDDHVCLRSEPLCTSQFLPCTYYRCIDGFPATATLAPTDGALPSEPNEGDESDEREPDGNSDPRESVDRGCLPGSRPIRSPELGVFCVPYTCEATNACPENKDCKPLQIERCEFGTICQKFECVVPEMQDDIVDNAIPVGVNDDLPTPVEPNNCPVLNCPTECPFRNQRDADGCITCKCESCQQGEEPDPVTNVCVAVSCESPHACNLDMFECHALQRVCVTLPCRQYQCVPKTKCLKNQSLNQFSDECVTVRCPVDDIDANPCEQDFTCVDTDTSCTTYPCKYYSCIDDSIVVGGGGENPDITEPPGEEYENDEEFTISPTEENENHGAEQNSSSNTNETHIGCDQSECNTSNVMITSRIIHAALLAVLFLVAL